MISKKTLNLNDGRMPVSYYKNDDGGAFFIIDEKNSDGANSCREFQTCRELFDDYFTNKITRIGYARRGINITNLNNFFKEIEKKLKLKEKVTFYNTNKSGIAIDVPDFWRTNKTRRQLFTLFIRAGINHYETDFYDTIDAYDLTANIKPLIFHFLKGNVKIRTGRFSQDGVVDTFASKDPSFIRECFVGGNGNKLRVADMVLTHPLPMK